MEATQPHLRIIYTRAQSLGSFLIRMGAWWGPWSHCGIVVGDMVIESLATKGGVVLSSLQSVINRSTHYEIVEVPCPDPQKAIDWAYSTLGKPYDWGGIFAIPLRERNWQSNNRWYCSEHVEAALVQGGRARFRSGMHGVSPCQSYFVR